MMFDAHCHLQFCEFDEDRDDALEVAIDAGLTGLIMAGYDHRRRELSARLTERAGIWATCGVHPWAVAKMNDAELSDALRRLEEDLEGDQWCGLGELGLDHYRFKDEEGRGRQRAAFVAQLGMAREKNLPVVIHGVRCHNTMIGILRNEGLPEAGGIMHGYSGSPRQVGTFLMLNLDISVGTPMTFANNERLREVVRQVPPDRLLVETDAPDRPPGGHRGERNELHLLQQVIDEVADAGEMDSSRVAQMTERNARSRFGLGEEVLSKAI